MDARKRGRPAVAVVAVTALTAAVAVGGAGAVGTHPRVILYGDSLAFESKDAFALALQRGNDVEVVDRTFGAPAICDQLVDRCPVSSSGAVRFGLAMAGPVRRDLVGR